MSLDSAEDAIELANHYGVADGYPLSAGQEFVLRAALGTRRNRTWAASRVGHFAGRQGGGKSDTIVARELAGLELFGEQLIIHTAHEFPTANESFMALAGIYENWDDLRARVRQVYYGNGTQGIVLQRSRTDRTIAGRILYKARTGGSVRGFRKAALVVYDEAQHLVREHVAASGPAKLSSPNSQSWYAGSGGWSSSAQAWAMRRQALQAKPGRLAYCEFTAERPVLVDGRVAQGPVLDVRDRTGWADANCGLGRWVLEEAMEDLLGELGDDLFARECLCIWEPEPGESGSVFAAGVWQSMVDEQSRVDSRRCFGLDVSPDWTWATFGVAGRRADGLVHVEAFDRRPGTGWVVARAVELYRKWRTPIRVVQGSMAAAFTQPMLEAGARVVEVSSKDYAAAVIRFVDAGNNDGLRHLGGSHLDSALKGAVLQSMGETAVWGRRLSKSDVTPLAAVTIAMGGIPTGKAPSRPMLVTSGYGK